MAGISKAERERRAALRDNVVPIGGRHMDDGLVAMVRDPEAHPEPHTALVHPREVRNYYAGGWVREDEWP